jgi:signal peptidase I
MTSSAIRRIAAAALLVALLALGWWLLAPTQLGGRTAYAVVSGSSMQPQVERGDFVLVRKRSEYAPGDVVLYDNPTVGANVLHRIVSRDSSGYRLKGDANSFVDDVRPTPDEIVGELWLVVPGFGSVVTWLQQPLNALLVILAALFVALAGGREARRSRRRPGAPARAVGVTSGGTSAPVFAPRTLRHAALAALALFGVLTVVGWARPGSHEVVEHGVYAHVGSFSYSAAVPRSPVYPDGRVTTGESAFVSLVHRLQVAFAYRLEARRAPEVSGTTEIDATISDGAGWKRSVVVAPPRAFEGDDAVAAGVLDLDHLGRVVAQMKQLTGSGTTTFTVTLVPRIHVAGEAGRHAIDTTFTPSLPFQLDQIALRLLDPEQGDPALEAREDPPVPLTVGTRVGLGLFSLPTDDARLLGLLGVMAAFVLLVISSTLARSGTGKAADERLRFGRRIVDAEAVVPPGRWVTDVADLETLVRIAESYERLVVHAAERGRDVYLVDDGVAVYRFSTPRWEPPAEAPTAILPAQSR